MTAVNASPRFEILPATRRVRVIHYHDLMQLRSVLRSLERSAATELVVTLILDEWFAGRLTSLVRRRRPGRALVVTAPPGRAAHVRLTDWATTDANVGWRRTVLEPDPHRALRFAAELAIDDESMVVLAPQSAFDEVAATCRRRAS